MDKKNLARYRELLEAKQRNLLEAYAKNKNLGQEAGDEASADMADKAASAYTKEFLYSLSNSDRDLLKDVQDALERVADADYGTCFECEEKMTRQRLDAIPWARYCVNCQELVEKGRLQR